MHQHHPEPTRTASFEKGASDVFRFGFALPKKRLVIPAEFRFRLLPQLPGNPVAGPGRRLPGNPANTALQEFERFHLVGYDVERVVDAYPVKVERIGQARSIFDQGLVRAGDHFGLLGQRHEFPELAESVVRQQGQLAFLQAAVVVGLIHGYALIGKEIHLAFEIIRADVLVGNMPQHGREQVIMIDGGHSVDFVHIALHDPDRLTAHLVAGCDGIIEIDDLPAADIMFDFRAGQAFPDPNGAAETHVDIHPAQQHGAFRHQFFDQAIGQVVIDFTGQIAQGIFLGTDRIIRQIYRNNKGVARQHPGAVFDFEFRQKAPCLQGRLFQQAMQSLAIEFGPQGQSCRTGVRRVLAAGRGNHIAALLNDLFVLDHAALGIDDPCGLTGQKRPHDEAIAIRVARRYRAHIVEIGSQRTLEQFVIGQGPYRKVG